MYQAPDFVKVSTKVKDVFTGYCMSMNEIKYNLMETAPGVACQDIEVFRQNYLEKYDYAPYMCYVNDAPF